MTDRGYLNGDGFGLGWYPLLHAKSFDKLTFEDAPVQHNYLDPIAPVSEAEYMTCTSRATETEHDQEYQKRQQEHKGSGCIGGKGTINSPTIQDCRWKGTVDNELSNNVVCLNC